MDQQSMKQEAAKRAAALVENNMLVGLGTGSTAAFFIEYLAQRVQEEDLFLRCVATSSRSREQAYELGLTVLDELPPEAIHITVDGADEIDPQLNLIKGLGGALLMEKLVAVQTEQEIIIADESKLVEELGSKNPLPVEVIPFGWQSTEKRLADIGLKCNLRRNGEKPYVTDMHHYILDCTAGAKQNMAHLAESIKKIPGVVDHGLFLGLAKRAIVASSQGIVEMTR